MNPRLSARVDSSDIVQDAYAEASRRLRQYSDLRGEELYRALRQLAYERTVDAYRRHLQAHRRTVLRELPSELPASRGTYRLVDGLVGRTSTPSRIVAHGEELSRLRAGLDDLASADRQVLVLRHLLQLDVEEIAELLHISRTAVTTRHLRAVQRLRRVLGQANDERRKPC